MISISTHLLSHEMCPIVLCTELQGIKHRLKHFLQVKIGLFVWREVLGRPALRCVRIVDALTAVWFCLNRKDFTILPQMVEAPLVMFGIAAYTESEIFKIGCPPELAYGEVPLQAWVSSAKMWRSKCWTYTCILHAANLERSKHVLSCCVSSIMMVKTRVSLNRW